MGPVFSTDEIEALRAAPYVQDALSKKRKEDADRRIQLFQERDTLSRSRATRSAANMKLLETLQTAAAKAEEEFEKAKSAYQYALVDDWRLSCEEDRQESLIERSLRALGNEEVEALIRETHRVWSLAVAQLRYDRKGRVVNEEMGKRRNRLASIIDEAKSLLSDGRSPAEIRDSVNVLGHEVRALTPLFSSDVAPMKATSLV